MTAWVELARMGLVHPARASRRQIPWPRRDAFLPTPRIGLLIAAIALILAAAVAAMAFRWVADADESSTLPWPDVCSGRVRRRP